ncbi:MAG: putative metal-dependent hydrolase [Gemmatimonadaceae bacterium]
MTTSDLRFPIGKPAFSAGPLSDAQRGTLIDEIAAAPAALQKAAKGLTESQLNTPYRPDGWSVRQLIHHVADSHMNAYVRCKLALTEDAPTIKPYDQAAWATLADSRDVSAAASLSLLDALHTRWVALLRSLTPAHFARTFMHPESGATTLDRMLGLYAWHGKHHIAHVTSLRERSGWL